jgi:hypothetical protein
MRLSLLKLFMTAEKFKAISTGTPFTLRVVTGHKGAVMCRKASGRGTVSLQLLSINAGLDPR